jgi:hypothetical protein
VLVRARVGCATPVRAFHLFVICMLVCARMYLCAMGLFALTCARVCWAGLGLFVLMWLKEVQYNCGCVRGSGRIST